MRRTASTLARGILSLLALPLCLWVLGWLWPPYGAYVAEVRTVLEFIEGAGRLPCSIPVQWYQVWCE